VKLKRTLEEQLRSLPLRITVTSKFKFEHQITEPVTACATAIGATPPASGDTGVFGQSSFDAYSSPIKYFQASSYEINCDCPCTLARCHYRIIEQDYRIKAGNDEISLRWLCDVLNVQCFPCESAHPTTPTHFFLAIALVGSNSRCPCPSTHAHAFPARVLLNVKSSASQPKFKKKKKKKKHSTKVLTNAVRALQFSDT
jgi:hypothetical protein